MEQLELKKDNGNGLKSINCVLIHEFIGLNELTDHFQIEIGNQFINLSKNK